VSVGKLWMMKVGKAGDEGAPAAGSSSSRGRWWMGGSIGVGAVRGDRGPGAAVGEAQETGGWVRSPARWVFW
jgi:hypothetical protein